MALRTTAAIILLVYLPAGRVFAVDLTNSVSVLEQRETTNQAVEAIGTAPRSPEPMNSNGETQESGLLSKQSALVDWHMTDLQSAIPAGQEGEMKELFEEALFQHRVGRDEQALEIYNRILAIEPENTFARFSQANMLIKLGRNAEALEILQELMAEFPNNYIILNNVAWIHATSGDISIRNGKKALSLARKAVLLEPNGYQIWNTLSEAYFVSANYEKALETAEIAFNMAVRAQVPEERLRDLARRVRKCRAAKSTMSIME